MTKSVFYLKQRENIKCGRAPNTTGKTNVGQQMHLKQPHFSFYFSHVDERNIILSAWKLIRKLTDKFLTKSQAFCTEYEIIKWCLLHSTIHQPICLLRVIIIILLIFSRSHEIKKLQKRGIHVVHHCSCKTGITSSSSLAC